MMGKLLQFIIKLFSKGKKHKFSPKPKKTKPDKKAGCKTNCKPLKTVKRPVKRHNPCKTRGKDPTKDENTMIDPDIDITPDLDALKKGDFVREGEDCIVGKRRYGYHPDIGTVYPKSGPGFVTVDRAQHQLFKQLNSGSFEDAMKFAKNKPGLTQEKIDRVLTIWRKCK
ncbi:MAG: hypothetical protein GY862_03650 [Gammaproteobacteria bacterium]|nr:hypothetical protein [Gammaproteobacteria bacterium]